MLTVALGVAEGVAEGEGVVKAEGVVGVQKHQLLQLIS